MSQAFYRKWRPKKWEEVIGQDHVVVILRNAITGGRVAHAYLFSGPRGTGKTTVARLLAKAVNCLAEKPDERPCNECQHCQAVNQNRFLDLIEIDAASNTSVDDVRDLRDKINFSPSQGKYKVYIIDEVHMLSTAAFNALLKTLEEPPPHAIFILATTEIHKIPATVLSRCQRHEFRRVPLNEIVSNLKQIVKAEKLKADDEALTLIARQATGAVRDAQSLLDQVASTGEKITLPLVQAVLGTATNQTILDLVDSIRDRQPLPALEGIHRALDAGSDPRALARQLVDYLRAVMLMQMGNAEQVEVTDEINKHMTEHAQAFTIPEVLHMIRAFNASAVDARGGWQPSLSLELAVAELLEAPETVESLASSEAESFSPMPTENTVKESRGGRSVGSSKGSTVARETESKLGAEKGASPKASNPSEEEPKARAESSKAAASDKQEEGAKISLAEIHKGWKQIRSVIKPSHPSLDGLLNSCKPLEIKGDTLVLAFASDVVLSKMDKPEQIELTRNAMAQVLGVDLQIRCVVANIKRKVPPNIDQNGMVAAALNQGGEIVDVQE
jgi:DNA polymerase-3 subunit gamma/tau